ncbi:MAG: hypothetical protein Q8R92_17240 [Deltaproteobacteria bacterium]|nr:hypothetical protein [Deltaproteobacteria bacterium]
MALPGKQFVAAWDCIEAIDKALEKAGVTAELALTYVRVLHEERLAALLGMQQARISALAESAVRQQENVITARRERDAARDTVAKLQRKIARLTKKTKSKA